MPVNHLQQHEQHEQHEQRVAFDRLLLIGHGSPHPEGNAEYLHFAELLASHLDMAVQPCFLECAAPSIAEGMRQCAEAGAGRVAVLPLFLGAAGHYKNDVPVLLAQARQQWPAVEFRYGTPIGAQYHLVSTLAERATAARDSAIAAAETALIVAARGSSDPASNAEVCKMARLLWEGRDYARVEVAFQSVTRPDVGTAIEQCARLGARQVVVLPYLLFTGFVHHDIEQQAQRAQQRLPQLMVRVAEHLGSHAGVLEAVAQRYDDIATGTATMTCDVCKYRHRMAGFEDDYGLPQRAHHHDHGHHHHDHGHHHHHHHGHHDHAHAHHAHQHEHDHHNHTHHHHHDDGE